MEWFSQIYRAQRWTGSQADWNRLYELSDEKADYSYWHDSVHKKQENHIKQSLLMSYFKQNTNKVYLEAVMKICASGANVNYCDTLGQNALWYAVESNASFEVF